MIIFCSSLLFQGPIHFEVHLICAYAAKDSYCALVYVIKYALLYEKYTKKNTGKIVLTGPFHFSLENYPTVSNEVSFQNMILAINFFENPVAPNNFFLSVVIIN